MLGESRAFLCGGGRGHAKDTGREWGDERKTWGREVFAYKNQNLNKYHTVKHLIHDYSENKKRVKEGKRISDHEVYSLAEKENRLIITFNSRHFKEIAERSIKTGIIGLSPNLTLDTYIDTRIIALLAKKRRCELFGHYNFISHQNEKVI